MNVADDDWFIPVGTVTLVENGVGMCWRSLGGQGYEGVKLGGLKTAEVLAPGGVHGVKKKRCPK